ADYNGVNGRVAGFQFDPAGGNGNVTLAWTDLGSGRSGLSPRDRDVAGFKAIVRNRVLSEAAKEWALPEMINLTPSHEVSMVNVAAGVDWTSAVSFGVKRANTAAHEVAHTFGLPDSYVNLHGVPSDVPPIPDLMNHYDPATGDLNFSAD